MAGIWESVERRRRPSGRSGIRHRRRGIDGRDQRNVFVEHYELQPIDPQTNGPQLFYGLRYHAHIVKPGEVETFHDQVGYWLWEPATRTVTQTLAIPRGQVLLAAGTAEPDATEFEVTADARLRDLRHPVEPVPRRRVPHAQLPHPRDRATPTARGRTRKTRCCSSPTATSPSTTSTATRSARVAAPDTRTRWRSRATPSRRSRRSRATERPAHRQPSQRERKPAVNHLMRDLAPSTTRHGRRSTPRPTVR